MATSKQLPDMVCPMGVPFVVEMVDVVDDEDSAGETFGYMRRIKIDRGMDSSKQWRVLLHEYVHAALFAVGVDSVTSSELNEIIVTTTEHAIEQFMRAHGAVYLEAIQADM